MSSESKFPKRSQKPPSIYTKGVVMDGDWEHPNGDQCSELTSLAPLPNQNLEAL